MEYLKEAAIHCEKQKHVVVMYVKQKGINVVARELGRMKGFDWFVPWSQIEDASRNPLIPAIDHCVHKLDK